MKVFTDDQNELNRNTSVCNDLKSNEWNCIADLPELLEYLNSSENGCNDVVEVSFISFPFSIQFN